MLAGNLSSTSASPSKMALAPRLPTTFGSRSCLSFEGRRSNDGHDEWGDRFHPSRSAANDRRTAAWRLQHPSCRRLRVARNGQAAFHPRGGDLPTVWLGGIQARPDREDEERSRRRMADSTVIRWLSGQTSPPLHPPHRRAHGGIA